MHVSHSLIYLKQAHLRLKARNHFRVLPVFAPDLVWICLGSPWFVRVRTGLHGCVFGLNPFEQVRTGLNGCSLLHELQLGGDFDEKGRLLKHPRLTSGRDLLLAFYIFLTAPLADRFLGSDQITLLTSKKRFIDR